MSGSRTARAVFLAGKAGQGKPCRRVQVDGIVTAAQIKGAGANYGLAYEPIRDVIRDRPEFHQGRSGACARQAGTDPRLPAADDGRRPHDRLGRGACALGPSRTRQDRAGRVRFDRRADRPDRSPRALCPRTCVPRCAGLVDDTRRSQHFADAFRQAQFRRGCRAGSGGGLVSGRTAGDRDRRERRFRQS